MVGGEELPLDCWHGELLVGTGPEVGKSNCHRYYITISLWHSAAKTVWIT